MSDKKKAQILYFAEHDSGTMIKIIVCAVVFHLAIVGVCLGVHFIDFKHEPEPIPVFEMVQVQQPQVKPAAPPRPKPPEPPKEVPPEPKKVKPKPEPKPKINEELPPEIKPEEEKKPEPEPEPVEEPQPEPEPDPEPAKDDFDIDDMDLPAAVEAPSLNPVGSVDMDPLMQAYLEQLKRIIMANFNPPGNLNVKKNIKTTVQFTIDRFGGITGITLKRSSGNSTWDHLSVRAVKISKAPELPFNFRAPNLTLHFNFTPN